MESDKVRALNIVRNAELVHPDLPLVEAFNDAIDGEQAARYFMKTYVDDRSNVNSTQFLKDWKDLLRLCPLLNDIESMWNLPTQEI
ncbi:hypothetical protein QC760_002450 [Botrytis cinerea]